VSTQSKNEWLIVKFNKLLIRLLNRLPLQGRGLLNRFLLFCIDLLLLCAIIVPSVVGENATCNNYTLHVYLGAFEFFTFMCFPYKSIS